MTAYSRISAVDLNLASKIQSQGGFLQYEDIIALKSHDSLRLMLLLVRCNNGRFLTPVQDVNWFCKIISDHAKRAEQEYGFEESMSVSDYVRDISLPAD